jgi:hypothetical protein
MIDYIDDVCVLVFSGGWDGPAKDDAANKDPLHAVFLAFNGHYYTVLNTGHNNNNNNTRRAGGGGDLLVLANHLRLSETVPSALQCIIRYCSSLQSQTVAAPRRCTRHRAGGPHDAQMRERATVCLSVCLSVCGERSVRGKQIFILQKQS